LRKIEGASSDIARILGQHSVGQIGAMVFNPSGSDTASLATGGVDGSIMLWRIPEGTAAGPAVASEQSTIHEMRFSSDGLHLLTRGYVKPPEEDNRESIIVHDLRSRTNKPVAAEFLKQAKWSIDQNMTLSPDGRLVAFCSRNVVAVWDMKEDRVREKHISASGNLWGINFTENARLAFILAIDSYPARFSAGIWNLETDTVRVGPSVAGARADYLNNSATISSDGSRFVAWGYNNGHIDGFYAVLSDLSLQPLAIPGLDKITNDIRFHFAFDAQGKRAVVGGSGKVWVWDLLQERVLKEVKMAGMGADDPVAVSSDGRWLAAPEQGKVVVWDLNHPDSKGPSKTIESACSFTGDRAQECIRRLCEKVSPSIAEKDLSDVFGSFEYNDLKKKALAEPCGHA
jgi:WD40 repeat protein